MSQKVVMLSQKSDLDLDTMKRSLIKSVDSTQKQVMDQFKSNLKDGVNQLNAELRGFIMDKNRELLKKVQAEVETKVLIEVRERMQVPGLIGENCPYSTLANFLLTFVGNTQ